MSLVSSKRAAIAAAVLSLAVNANAATTTVLNFGDGGWVNGDTRDAGGTNVGPAGRVDLNVTSPPVPPSGHNSLRLTTDTASSKATINQVNLNLGSIPNFSGSYSWYKENAGAPAPALKLGIDTTDSNPASSRPFESNWDKFLIYEPYDNPDSADPGTNVWVSQTFGPNTGTWWMVDRTAGNLQVNPPHSSITLQQWANDATYGTRLSTGSIVAVQLGQGSGNANLTSYVDTLSYSYAGGSETYYFGDVVPEPGSAALLVIGAGAVLSRRARRQPTVA